MRSSPLPLSAYASPPPTFFFFNDAATTEIYTLSLHDALPISPRTTASRRATPVNAAKASTAGLMARSVEPRSEEHTSELQSRRDLVCRLLLEKKKKRINKISLRRTEV